MLCYYALMQQMVTSFRVFECPEGGRLGRANHGTQHSKSQLKERIRAMAKFLIESPHEAEPVACVRAVEVFLQTGSHFLTNADWGCLDGEHKAWIILEAESKEEARFVLPPAYRPGAKIVKLAKFTMEDIDELRRYHQGQESK